MDIKKIKLKPITELNKDKESKLNNMDLSEGFTCDIETGICGPEKKVKENINTKEGK